MLMLVLDEISQAQWVVVLRRAGFLLSKVRCVRLGSVVSDLRGRKCVRVYGGGIIMREIFPILGKYKCTRPPWYRGT